MKNPADTFEHAIIKQSGVLLARWKPGQKVHRSLANAQSELGSALSEISIARARYNPPSPYTVDFTPDEAKRLKAAEATLQEARETIFDAFRSIEDIDLGLG